MSGNKMALDALTALYRGYVNTLQAGRDRIIFLGGECDTVEKMEASDPWLISARAALAALQAEPQPEADMFWDSDDGESFGHSIQDLIAERDVGEVVTVDRAMRLPSIKVRVISGETDEDDNTWEEVRPPPLQRTEP